MVREVEKPALCLGAVQDLEPPLGLVVPSFGPLPDCIVERAGWILDDLVHRFVQDTWPSLRLARDPSGRLPDCKLESAGCIVHSLVQHPEGVPSPTCGPRGAHSLEPYSISILRA